MRSGFGAAIGQVTDKNLKMEETRSGVLLSHCVTRPQTCSYLEVEVLEMHLRLCVCMIDCGCEEDPCINTQGSSDTAQPVNEGCCYMIKCGL